VEGPCQVELQIINANNSSVSTSRHFEHTFERLESWGIGKVLTNETMKAYLKDGKVTVRARVSVKMPDDWASAQLLTERPLGRLNVDAATRE
jgi:hypothetical protein